MNLNDLEKRTIISGSSNGEKIRALVCGHSGAMGKALIAALISHRM
jgi:hypothetical protein